MQAQDCTIIVQRLGLQRHRGRWAPCQAGGCQHTGDGRYALRVVADHWWCNVCGAEGDAADLVSWNLLRRPGGEAGAEFRRVVLWLEGREAQANQGLEALPPPEYPPEDQVKALFTAAVPASQDSEVADYLRFRGIRPSLTPAWAVPKGFSAPWWPRVWSGRFRLLAPLYGPTGAIRTLHARDVLRDGDPEGKTRWPRGCASGCSLFANRVGRRALMGNWEGIKYVVAVEGLTDYLTAAAAFKNEGATDAALIGVESGSAAALRLLRTQVGIPWHLATHDDIAGDRYATAAIDALAPRACYRAPMELFARRAV